MRALISVYDKTGLVPFARGLADLGFELVASGGTATTLRDAGLVVMPVEELTGFPELLGGRVKTLHPRVHAGILARRSRADDVAQLAEQGIEPFDLVCVNLYPFELIADRAGMADDDVVEMIDVGGPSMLRAAAKNFASVTPVSRPGDYGERPRRAARAEGPDQRRRRGRRLAGAAFAASAAYEAAIARWFQPDDELPETFVPAFDKVAELTYGENPHQRAGLLRRARLAQASALAGRAAGREAALVQQPQRPLRRASARARAGGARLRDREARESRAGSASPRGSRTRTRRRWPPIRSRPTAASSS